MLIRKFSLRAKTLIEEVQNCADAIYALDKIIFLVFFSTGPKRHGGDMENLDFENFFGSSVAIHKKRAVSCAYREQPKGKSYVDSQSTMGKNGFIFLCFSHPLFCTIVTIYSTVCAPS